MKENRTPLIIMNKKMGVVIIIVGVVTTFLGGCASVEGHYRSARRLNTISAYEEFVDRYPNSPYTSEAREKLNTLKDEKAFNDVELKNSIIACREFIQRYPNSKFIEEVKKRTTESDEAALKRTYRIETIQAYQGFIESYTKSEYLPLVRSRIEFLKGVKPATLKSFKQFIAEHPNNPFVSEAKATFPILWLREREKIGVLINISKMISWKGIFGGGRVTEKELCQKIFDGLKKDLEKEDIQAVLLDNLEDAKTKKIQTVLVMEYEEKEGKRVPYSSYPPRPLHDASVDNLSNAIGHLLTGPQLNISSSFTIKDVNTGFEYYSKIPNLNLHVERDQMVKALGLFRERAIPSLMIAFNDKDLIVRQEAVKKLIELKDPSAVQSLIVILKEGDSLTQIEAAKALGKLGDVQAVEPLIAALKEGSSEVSLEMANALKNLTGKDFSKLAYEKQCSELLKKGQLKQGITLEECVKHLCKDRNQ